MVRLETPYQTVREVWIADVPMREHLQLANDHLRMVDLHAIGTTDRSTLLHVVLADAHRMAARHPELFADAEVK